MRFRQCGIQIIGDDVRDDHSLSGMFREKCSFRLDLLKAETFFFQIICTKDSRLEIVVNAFNDRAFDLLTVQLQRQHFDAAFHRLCDQEKCVFFCIRCSSEHTAVGIQTAVGKAPDDAFSVILHIF